MAGKKPVDNGDAVKSCWAQYEANIKACEALPEVDPAGIIKPRQRCIKKAEEAYDRCLGKVFGVALTLPAGEMEVSVAPVER